VGADGRHVVKQPQGSGRGERGLQQGTLAGERDLQQGSLVGGKARQQGTLAGERKNDPDSYPRLGPKAQIGRL